VTEKTCPTCHRPLPPDALLCPVCALLGARNEAAPTGVPPLEEIQAAFPELEVLECIGRGGMGIVYKARQPHLDRFVALKILAPELSVDPGFAERFSREALTLAKLSHPHIVGIHDYGQHGEFCFLLMEYVDGVNLRQAMRAARFTPEQALALIPDLCTALQFAHDHGVLHRDIKPENILIDTRGRVRIADFGIAQLLSEGPSHLTLTATGSALGSAAYMAPEQIEASGEIDHRADIYSLGVVFYEMLTGGLPLGRFPLPSEKSTASAGIDDVVMRALEKERERRYQSADAVRSGLDHASTYKAATPNRPADPADQQKRIAAWSLGLLGGGLVAALVGLVTSPVILGFGAVAFIFGMLGCWWLLIGMKSGRYQATRRKLLLVVAFFPVLLGMLWLLALVPLLRGFTDVIYSRQPLPLLWIIVPFVGAVISGKLLWKLVALPDAEKPVPRFFHRWAPVLGTIALLLSLLAGKHLSMRLQLLNQYVGLTYQILEARTHQLLGKEDAALVKAAAYRAAGDYADFFRIEFPPSFQSSDPKYSGYPVGAMGVEFVVDHPRDGRAHINAYEQRLRALLPARIQIDSGNRGLHQREIEFIERITGRIFGIGLVVLLGTASLLIIFSGRKAFIFSLISGLLVMTGLSAVSTWPAPAMLPPVLGDRPALPELPLHDEDFRSSEAALDSLLKAAALKNAPTFLKAFPSDELDDQLRARLIELMPFFASCRRSKNPEYDEARTSAKLDLNFWSQRIAQKPRMREGIVLTLKLQQGEWKISGIAHLLGHLQDTAAHPYFKSEY
jgi:predicted Ser/Thr protein kinase